MAVSISPSWFGTQSSQAIEGAQTAKEKLEGVSFYTGGTGSQGGGGAQYKPPTGSTTITTPIVPTGPAPTLGSVAPFVPPALDEGMVKEETRKAVSAPLRSLRRQTRETLLRHIDAKNPAVRREYLRAALRGHGEALSGIFGQAQQVGRSAAERERAVQMQAEVLNFQQRQAEAQAKFQAAMQIYMSKYGQKSTTKNQYGSTSGSGTGAYRLVPSMVGAVSGMATGYRKVYE